MAVKKKDKLAGRSSCTQWGMKRGGGGRRDGGGRGKGRQNEVRGFVRPAVGGSNKTC